MIVVKKDIAIQSENSQTKIDVQKQIESEFERTKNELLKEFEYLKDVE